MPPSSPLGWRCTGSDCKPRAEVIAGARYRRVVGVIPPAELRPTPHQAAVLGNPPVQRGASRGHRARELRQQASTTCELLSTRVAAAPGERAGLRPECFPAMRDATPRTNAASAALRSTRPARERAMGARGQRSHLRWERASAATSSAARVCASRSIATLNPASIRQPTVTSRSRRRCATVPGKSRIGGVAL